MNEQVVSKQRVADYGEVFTNPDIVNAMLDLVKQETERVDSRFLDPACGIGNFLIEILNRKLRVVEKKYRRSQLEFERNLRACQYQHVNAPPIFTHTAPVIFGNNAPLS